MKFVWYEMKLARHKLKWMKQMKSEMKFVVSDLVEVYL